MGLLRLFSCQRLRRIAKTGQARTPALSNIVGMNAPDTPIVIPRFRRLALVVCMFLITASMGFLQPFVPLYLEASGLNREQIGGIAGLGAALAILVQPLLGRLSDRMDARRPLMSLAAASAGLAYFSYSFARGPVAFLLLTALGVNGTLYLNAVGGVLIGRMMQGTHMSGNAYARYRVWGSVGYILVAMLLGGLLNRGLPTGAKLSRSALDPVFWYGPLLFFAIALIAWLVPDRKRTVGPTPQADGQRAPLSHNVRAFLLAYFLYQFALYGASAYISLFLKSLGATPLWITGTFATGVVCEVLVMTQIGRWTDLYGRRPALAIAFILMPLRLLCYIPATGPLWVLVVQSLHGFNFGIMGAIAIVFINDTAHDQHRGLAQARLSGTGGLATAMSPALCGWIVQHWGMGWMFAAMSGIGAVAAFLFLSRVHESHPDAAILPARASLQERPLLRLLAAPPGKAISPDSSAD